MVKINIAYPPYGSSQLIEVDDEKKWRVFLDKRLTDEVPADSLGDEFKGYVFKITGGYDKEGFSMMQGVLLNSRVKLLLDGSTGQYTPRRHGARKRKSVRGCIVGTDMSCLNVTIVKRGPTDLPKLTDEASNKPSTKGPKRANNIRKAWGLSKKDDVTQYVVKRTVPGKDGKKDRIKSPKIQRLITPVVRARRRRILKAKKDQHEKSKKEASDYANLLKQLRAQKRAQLLSKRRENLSSKTGSHVKTPAKTSTSTTTTAAKTAPVKTAPTKIAPTTKTATTKAAKTTPKTTVTKSKTVPTKIATPKATPKAATPKTTTAPKATTTKATTTTTKKAETKKTAAKK